MKHIYLLPEDEDIQRVIVTQVNGFMEQEDIEFWSLDEADIKADVLSRTLPEDDYFVFCPLYTFLLSSPNLGGLNDVVQQMRKHELDYVRLRRVGVGSSKRLKGSQVLHVENGNSLYLVPHIFSTKAFAEMIENSRKRSRLYWESISLAGLKGASFHHTGSQPHNSLSYWHCDLYDTVSDIVTPHGYWNKSYLEYNNQPLKRALEGLGIDPRHRGVGSIGGCCR